MTRGIIDIDKLNHALDEIQIATYNAEPIIRCKDCKHNRDGICGWHYGAGYRWAVDDDDDFCSVGERKEECTK